MTSKGASMPAQKKPSSIFKSAASFSSFSVNDLKAAKDFYSQKLGLDVSETEEALELHTGDNTIFIYPKPNHAPASFTVLNFEVTNIEETIQELSAMGISLERYNLPDLKTDERGIFNGPGRRIAWFKDPADNILSVIEEE
jgi:catechol 2,3-dioxygenase-like lactoylglutathione lyase family enzyme